MGFNCKTYLAVSLITTLGAACVGSTVGVQKVRAAKPRSADCTIEIFTAGAAITKPWEVVCLIDSMVRTNSEDWSVESAAIVQAKKAACDCGADALIAEAPLPAGSTGLGSDNVLMEGFRYLFGFGKGSRTIKAIRYTNADRPVL